MPTVFANGRSILHQGDGNTHIAAPPDVCKVPTPAGPVPTPLVNMAQDSMLSKGSRKTTIEDNPVALSDSEISTSSGDEPGTAGGLISSKFKGKLTWGGASVDVKVEGKGVVRFLDPTFQNGNTFNTAFISQGGTGWAYGDDFDGPCPICGEGPDEHRVLETPKTVQLARELLEKLAEAHKEYEKLVRQRNQETDRSEAHRLSEDLGKKCVYKKERGNGGYMVAVMICKCNKKFAAMSGKTTLNGFAEVVESLGWKLCGDPTGKEDYATAADFESANPAISSPEKKAKFQARWGKIKIKSTPLYKGARRIFKGYNPSGVCAAQKIISKSGHVPAAMTEMYYSPIKQSHEVRIFYRHIDALRSSIDTIKFDGDDYYYWLRPGTPGTFGHGDTVPSCHTCKSLLPLVLCNVKKRNCPKLPTQKS